MVVYSCWGCSSLLSLASSALVKIKHNLVLGHSPWSFSVRSLTEFVQKSVLAVLCEFSYTNIIVPIRTITGTLTATLVTSCGVLNLHQQ